MKEGKNGGLRSPRERKEKLHRFGTGRKKRKESLKKNLLEDEKGSTITPRLMSRKKESAAGRPSLT